MSEVDGRRCHPRHRLPALHRGRGSVGAYAVRSLYIARRPDRVRARSQREGEDLPVVRGRVLLLIAVIVVAIRSQTGRLAISLHRLSRARLAAGAAVPRVGRARTRLPRSARQGAAALLLPADPAASDYALAKLGALTTRGLADPRRADAGDLPRRRVLAARCRPRSGASSPTSSAAWSPPAIIAIVLSVVALLIASLISRRMIAAAAIVGAVPGDVGGGASRSGRSSAATATEYGNLLGPQLLTRRAQPVAVPRRSEELRRLRLRRTSSGPSSSARSAALLLLVRYRKVAHERCERDRSGDERVNSVGLRWYGNVVAVNDVTMTLGAGVTGLLGPNGAGKTTVLHMMAGFLPPSQGTVTIGGAPAWRNPDDLPHARPRRRARGGARLPHRLRVRAGQRAAAQAARPGRRRPGARSRWSRWPTRRTGGCRPTPRACGSAPGSRRRSCTIPRCCCSTSRSTAWIRASACT